jgi:hypothetical protein
VNTHAGHKNSNVASVKREGPLVDLGTCGLSDPDTIHSGVAYYFLACPIPTDFDSCSHHSHSPPCESIGTDRVPKGVTDAYGRKANTIIYKTCLVAFEETDHEDWFFREGRFEVTSKL